LGSCAACLCRHQRRISPPSRCHCRRVQMGVAARRHALSSLGVHGGCDSCWRSTLPICHRWGRMGARLALPPPPRWSWCTVSRFGGGATLPPHCCGWDRMWLQLTLAEGILAAASSWPSLGSLTLSSWLGSHAAHSLGRESQQPRHGWDHMQSASERRQAVGSLLSGSRVANLKASWRGGQRLMLLVAGIDAAVSSLLSSLQWSCLPSPYAPQQREDGKHDGANKGAWHSLSASAVAGVVCWRMSMMRSGLQAFVAAVGKYHTVGEKSHICDI